MQSVSLPISTQPLGWILRDNGFLLPFGILPNESEALALGDISGWKEVKVVPEISILTCDSEIVCPSDLCRKKLTKNHSFETHIRDHLGLKTLKSDALNTNMVKVNNAIVINYYCNHKGCYYSMNDGDRFFTKLKYLKQHYLKVHAPKTFICLQCEKSFGTAVFLETHSRMCGQTFNCSCNASYGTLEALQTHARRKKHVYDLVGYRNILKSLKPANSLGKVEEEILKEKGKDMEKVSVAKVKKMHPPVLLPRPQTVISNIVSAPWVYDEFSCPPLKVNFGTQTVPMQSIVGNGQPSSSQNEMLKLAKRKKSAETQTSHVRVRISTETQTANVIKRRRSNKKKQLAEAETQCHTEESELNVNPGQEVNPSGCEDKNEEQLPKQESLLEDFLFPTKESTANNGTNTNDSLFDQFNSFSCDIENGDSTSGTVMDNIFRDLEVHSETQTDPNFFGTHNSTNPSILEDFDAQIHVAHPDVSEFLNFVTTETQTLPGIVISPSIMNISTNSSPTDTANTQTVDNLGFLIDSYGSGINDMSSVFDDLIQFPSFFHTETDSILYGSNYLETMDNETQTQTTPGFQF